jgi:hypothetical protein
MNKICCNICNKVYSSKYMTQHKKTLLNLENAYEYYLEERSEQKFEDYIIQTYLYNY